jgi:hypothetical protein
MAHYLNGGARRVTNGFERRGAVAAQLHNTAAHTATFALHPEVEAGLKALVGDAEERLDELQREQVDPFEDAPGG